MKQCIGKMAVLAAMVLMGGAGANAAQAQERGAVVLRNPTSMTLHYQFKWGDGTWTSYSLLPGCKRFHSCSLDDFGQAPTPYVRFNWVPGTDIVKSHRLRVYSVSNPWDGKPHYFCYSSDGRFIYLYND